MRRIAALGGLLFLLSGCTTEDAPASTGTGTETAATADTSTSTTDTTSSTSDAPSSGSTSTTDPTASSSASSGEATAGPDATGGGNNIPVDCGGTTYACGDGQDNDGDGRIDLFDPECTGPCDDDESSFQTGIPGDNVDCRQDCFFDGNSGQGDDGCLWSLRCDPANPGADIGCEYTGGNSCNNIPANQTEDCIEFCEPFVPPGCDCFGCCRVSSPNGDVNVFLNSGPDCSLDNLGACQSCTPSEDCINECEPEMCELCFGQDELPPGCDDPTCFNEMPCDATSDCPTDWYCFNQCCYPPPAG